ncbi:MAG: glycerate kinase [Clostridiales bacterium]|nr:glycerate kinase [Clostridiales bacterium]
MDILKFALGIRFDFYRSSVSDEDVGAVVSELTGALTVKDVVDLQIFGGVCPIDSRDSSGVYTVVFMNGGIKQMRALYAKLNGDARIHAMLEAKEPFIQNNVIRNFEDMEYFGEVGMDGVCRGGSGRSIVFSETADRRRAYTGKGHILIAPNAFKGTISSLEAIKHISAALRKRLPETELIPVPVADGGDGTLETVENAVLSMRRSMTVTGPYGEKIKADYLVADGIRAVIESALASGLALCGGAELDPLRATSFGTGELIMRAAHEGLKEIYVGLGGSATNDCGIGLARALGCRFLDNDGNEIDTASEMERIAKIDRTNLDPMVKSAKIKVMCDVSNPLTGPNGATCVFGPQKGADGETLAKLEAGMKNMAVLLDEAAGKPVSLEKGAGAAGGIGTMLMALFDAECMSGAEALLDIAEFDRKLRNASLVITGEGRIDSTSLNGKAVGRIIEHAKKAGVEIALIAGCRGDGYGAVEAEARFTEYTGSETDALRFLDEAADRLARRIAEE